MLIIYICIYFSKRPYLFYFDLTKCISYATALGGCQTTQLCVKECPSTYFSYLQLRTASVSEIQNKMKSVVYCTDDVDKTTVTTFQALQNLVQRGKCVSYTVKSVPGNHFVIWFYSTNQLVPVLQRCFPEAIFNAVDNVNNVLNSSNSLDYLKRTFGDDALIPQDIQITGQSSE